MSNLKQLRNRIKSVRSTQKITKAMNMVAASKLRQVRNQINDSTNYVRVLNNALGVVCHKRDVYDIPADMHKFFQIKKSYKNILLVILSSERGLCGGFNNSIIKAAKEDIALFEKENKAIKLMIIGKKAYEAFKNSQYAKYVEAYINIAKENSEDIAICIRQKFVEMFQGGLIDACYLYFNEFKNAIKQSTSKMQILPINVSDIENHDVNYGYDGEGMLLNMLNLYLLGAINLALIQNKASEEGARMIAMDHSTKNAAELINKLTLKFNGTRQAIITNELIEIISGAEAV